MRIDIHGTDLPGLDTCGHQGVHVGLQRGRDVVETRPADARSVRWTVEVDVREAPGGGIDVRGPFVHGRPGDRFLYLSWGTVDDDGTFQMFRRAKLLLRELDPNTVSTAASPGKHLVARLGLTGADGGPLCASVKPPSIDWSVGES